MNKYYVYSYLREDLTPYYIGKGIGNRAFIKHHRAKPPSNDRIKIIKTNLTEAEAHHLEKELIAHYGRKDLGNGILINLTDGGEGLSNPSVNTRKKLSDAKRNETQETKRRRSIAAKNRPKRKTSDETKIKIGNANRGLKRSDVSRKKMSDAKLGKSRTPEAIEKSANGLRGKKKPITVCPHCGKTGGISALHRWHFNNCKFKEN